MDRDIKVGIADMKIARQEGVLITYALGSCIGISLYDPGIKLASLLHIMLPGNAGRGDGNPYKYADDGITETLRKMAAFGGLKNRYICKIAGGAKMFDLGNSNSIGNIGERNIVSVQNRFKEEGIRIARQDVGANYARTMSVDVATGMVKIRTFGKQEIIM